MEEAQSKDPEILSPLEARILGSLIEKEIATPDYYPLTLNSLLAACNQKSNRNPIMQLDEESVAAGLEALRQKGLALLVTQSGARVAKYRHSFQRSYQLPDAQVAIIAELLLRGPQTVGELRSRCERLHPFGDLESIRRELVDLEQRSNPLATELPRQPGKKAARFAQLLSGPPQASELAESNESAAQPISVKIAAALPPEAEARFAELEELAARQQEEITRLRDDFDAFRSQFD